MLNALIQALKNLISPPVTLQYPLAEDITLPAQYRGLIEYSAEDCIFCDKCEHACPPRAIIFFQEANGDKVYRYNPHLCIYCGECVRACPKPQEALWQSEKKQPFALRAENVNSEWKVWEERCSESRDAFAAAKKAKKAAKAQSDGQGEMQ
ncbi:MAG: 4Fe-4S binding protein [Campylobacterales bacterium]|nr:4Fe-4S binding protein [Campylobacterales bacterium]